RYQKTGRILATKKGGAIKKKVTPEIEALILSSQDKDCTSKAIRLKDICKRSI
ncbi:hypothetical protein BB558_006029, partial [Smittium angustum]